MKKMAVFLFGFFYAAIVFANNDLTFETKTLLENNSQPKYQIKINYPQIKSPSNVAEQKFNNAAKQWAINRSNEFKKSFKDWNTENLSPEMKANGSTLTVNYDLTTLNNSIISLRYNADSYMAGAAHPSHVYTSLNYDLVNNKELTLADLFKPNSNYLESISQIATKKVTKKLQKAANGHVEIFKDGLKPALKNFNVWNLKSKGIRFTFNEYQVAPYVFGPQKIIISYKRLSTDLSPNSALANCLGNNNCELKIREINARN